MHKCGRLVKILFIILQRYMPLELAFRRIKNLKLKEKNMRVRQLKNEQKRIRNKKRAV